MKFQYLREDIALADYIRALVRSELKRGTLQYRCGLCRFGKESDKFSDLINHLLVHGINAEDFIAGSAANERTFDRILLRAELAFPPHHVNGTHASVERSLNEREVHLGSFARRQHNQSLRCLSRSDGS